MYENIGINEKEVVLNGKAIKNLRTQLRANVDKAVAIMPFTMYGGFKDFSELGEEGLNNKINTYSYFERVFTGKSSVVALWDGSTAIKNTAGELHKEFSVGDSHIGISFETQLASDFDEFSDTDFTSLHDTETLSVVFPDLNLHEEDLYKVYLAPQETQRWLRISTITRIKDTNNNVIFTEVQFTSMNDEIEQTGVSLYNHIQKAAVGENYAWPLIENNEVKHQVLGGEGVNEYQIEIMGNAAIAGIGFVGRDVDAVKVNEPKWLLTEKILQPIESQVKRISAAENNYTLLRDAKFSLQTYYADWKTEMQQGYDLTIRKQYEGMFHFDRTKTDLHASEQDKNIWNDDIVFSDSNNITIDGQASPYVRGTIGLPTMKVPNFLNSNLLAYNWLTQLPQEVEQSVAWRSTDIPVIGSMLNKISLGIPWGWRDSNTLVKTSGINMLASTPQTNYFSKAVFNDKNGRGLIPMEAFNNNDDNPIASIVGSKTTSMVIRGKLSDTFNGKTTDDLGKSTNKYSGEDMTPVNKYFIIDKQIALVVGKADYIITFFKDGVRKWSSRYSSTAKWTDNPRDWLNFVSFSPWNEFQADATGLNWNQIDELPIPSGATGSYPPRTFKGKIYTNYNLADTKTVITYTLPASVLNQYTNYSLTDIVSEDTLPTVPYDVINPSREPFKGYFKNEHISWTQSGNSLIVKVEYIYPADHFRISTGEPTEDMKRLAEVVRNYDASLTLFNK